MLRHNLFPINAKSYSLKGETLSSLLKPKVEVSTVNELVTPNSFHTTILPVPSFDFSIQKVHYSYQNICV